MFKSIISGSLLWTLCASQVFAANVVPLSDPENKGQWVLNKEVSDEFNGKGLDLDKWLNLGLNGDYYGQWKGRAPSQFNPNNVSVQGGFLTLTTKWEPDFNFADETFNNGYKYGQYAPVTTAAIITKKKFKYGYMEVRAKAADGPVSSAYWTTGKDGEMDVFEHFGNNPNKKHSSYKYHTSFHDWRKGSPMFGKRIWTNDHILDFRVADDFHVYGYEWDENYIKIFIDGRLVNCLTKESLGDKWVAYNEQKVWIDSETFDWEIKPQKLKASDFGDGQKFIVDYSRIWQHEVAGSGCNIRENLVVNPSFEQGLKGWKGQVSFVNDGHLGRVGAETLGDAIVEQTVTVKPNTTYILSAWGKSPQTNMKDKWFNAYLGVKDYGSTERTNKFFFPYYHQKSLQFTTGKNNTSATIYFTSQPQGERFTIDDVALVEAGVAKE